MCTFLDPDIFLKDILFYLHICKNMQNFPVSVWIYKTGCTVENSFSCVMIIIHTTSQFSYIERSNNKYKLLKICISSIS